MPACHIKSIARACPVILALLLFNSVFSVPASALPICQIENYKSSDPQALFPYVQWRRCRVAGKHLVYLRVFTRCGKKTCTPGWMRVMRRGRHYFAVYTENNIVRTIRFYFPNQTQLSMNIRDEGISTPKIKNQKLTFKEF